VIKATFPDKSSIIMIGSPGIGLLEFNISMAKNYIENGDGVIFVAVDMLPADVISAMESFGINVKDTLGRSLFFIDYHSSLLGAFEGRDSKQNGEVRQVSDIEGIMFNVSAIANETGKPVRIFLHSLSTLFLYNQTNVVLKFFQISSSRIRSEFGTGFFTIHDGVHDEKTMNHLMAIADGVIELMFDDNLNRRMRIRHMKGYPSSSQWIPFEIKHVYKGDRTSLLEWR
jgi:KaiC/GvpD/RAD55 family RecA-like ATPase